MTIFGKSLSVKGELHTSEDITIEGRIVGHILCDDCAIVFGPTSDVTGETLARDITVFGRVSGQLVATDVVDVRADATVAAQVISKRFLLEAGSRFDGRVEPQHLEAALRVAKFQQQKRDAARA
jgi:cytoskeletal protein CcmA (bactofilin family)